MESDKNKTENKKTKGSQAKDPEVQVGGSATARQEAPARRLEAGGLALKKRKR